MSTADDLAPAPQVPADAEKPNSLQRIGGVLFNPAETFESIARRPDIKVPLLIAMLLYVVSGVLVAMHIDFKSVAREVIEMNPNVPPDRVDSAAGFTAMTMKFFAYASPFLIVLAIAVAAGAILIACRMFGGEGDFKQAFSVTTYAWYPRIIKGVLATIVLMMKNSPSFAEISNPIMSNLASVFGWDPKTQPLAFALGNTIDLFTIWSVILLIFGFAPVAKFSKGRTAVVVIVLWVLVNIVTLIGPAMQALRAH